MKAVRFAESAEQRLDEILLWSLSEFGVETALAYQRHITETCQRIADGTAHTQSCTLLISDGVQTEMRFARSGRHFIIFVDRGDLIGIIDLLHSSSDLGAQLSSLATWDN